MIDLARKARTAMGLLIWMGICVQTCGGAEATVRQLPNGRIAFENDVVRLTFNPDQGVWPGFEGGIQSWHHKPTNVEMVAFQAPGFARNMNGHIFTIHGHPTQMFNLSRMGVDPETGAAGCLLVKDVEGQRHWLRLVLRAGSAVLEATFGQNNESGAPQKNSLKLHNLLCPGARDGTYQLGDVAYYPTEEGVVTIEQKPQAEVTMGLFEAPETHRFPADPWKVKPWLREDVPALSAFWQGIITPRTKDGFVFLNDPAETAQLLSWVGESIMTTEQKTRACLLGRGESWQMTVAVGGFSGMNSMAWANRFAVFESLPQVREGRVQCRLTGLLEGKLEVRRADGTVAESAPLQPGTMTELAFPGPLDGVSFVVFDVRGTEVGRFSASGEATVDLPAVRIPATPHPTVKDTVYMEADERREIADLVRQGRLIVVYGQQAEASEEQLARRIGRRLDLPVTSDLMLGTGTSRRGRAVLCVGRPATNRGCDFLAGTGGLMPEGWPPKNTGVIRWTEEFVFTGAPVVLVAARDEKGLKRAADAFTKAFEPGDAEDRENLRVWTGSPFERIFKYDRGEPATEMTMEVARRGFATAYIGLSAPTTRSFSDVRVRLREEDGEWPPERAVWKRLDPRIYLAEYYVNGGNPERAVEWPDPLREITTQRRAGAFSIPAGETRGVWISLRPSRKMRPGDVRLRLDIEADGEKTSLPLTLRIRDIVLPASALEFQPFVHPSHVADFTVGGRPYDDRTYFRMYKTLIKNLVDHGATNFPVGEFYVRDVQEDNVELITRFVDRELDIIEREARGLPWSITLRGKKLVTEAYKMYRRAFPDRYDYSQWHWKGTHSPVERLTARALAEYFERRGILDRVYAKVADEPGDFEEWLETTKVWRDEGLQIHTHFNKFNETYRKGEGIVDLWVPNYTTYNADFFERRMRDGEKVWWYICWIPRTIVPCRLEGIRGWLWQTAKYDLQGISMWGVGCWGYHNDLYREGNGVNSMIYPTHGRGRAIHDSIRWEQVRAGIEDHKYVARLRREIAEAEKDGREEAAEQANKTLNRVFERLVPNPGRYNVPPEDIRWARERLATAITELAEAPRNP